MEGFVWLVGFFLPWIQNHLGSDGYLKSIFADLSLKRLLWKRIWFLPAGYCVAQRLFNEIHVSFRAVGGAEGQALLLDSHRKPTVTLVE